MFPGAPPPACATRLVHHYFDINLDVLWQTITEDLPQMLTALPSEDQLDGEQPAEPRSCGEWIGG